MQLCGIPHLRQTHLSPILGFLKLVTHLRNYLKLCLMSNRQNLMVSGCYLPFGSLRPNMAIQQGNPTSTINGALVRSENPPTKPLGGLTSSHLANLPESEAPPAGIFNLILWVSEPSGVKPPEFFHRMVLLKRKDRTIGSRSGIARVWTKPIQTTMPVFFSW